MNYSVNDPHGIIEKVKASLDDGVLYVGFKTSEKTDSSISTQRKNNITIYISTYKGNNNIVTQITFPDLTETQVFDCKCESTKKHYYLVDTKKV